MTSSSHNVDHLDPSELGTKEYWNALYTRELTNHASDTTDIGTVWFDDSDAEAKMIAFLNRLAEESSRPAGGHGRALSRHDASLLDLGCGNGSMLFSLREQGWSGPALGVDYSPQSVQLARQVGAAKSREKPDAGADDKTPPVRFEEWDILMGPWETVLPGPERAWDVVLDKGTFDAVSLSGERTDAGGRICEVYPERVLPLVREGGLFLITSCNWTEDELTAWFAGRRGPDGGRFVPAGRIEYRTFSFGGVKGQTISTLCFRKT
ncbi:hypothetical protein E4U53_004142 [Claviceps sorghi]|nr:hypothetical protein E4U53_004142 [Claviceps sorghi]